MTIRRTSFPSPTALAALAAVALVGSGAYVVTVSGQAPTPVPAADTYQTTVQPVLAKNCVNCHSDRLHTANLSFEVFHNGTEALQQRDVWVKVLDKLKSGTMPPRTMPPMAAADRDAVLGWIESSLGVASASSSSNATADPGRITARRLNRAEYNNTIRDLLGVTLRPADEFPVDDSGYGFDNIGDVLSMSPMLMEKYMSAAKVVSKAAVFGEPYQTPPGLIVKLIGKKIQDDMPVSGNNITPYSVRGALFTTYHFPVDAEYEFHVRYQNFRGGEPVVTTDGNGPARGRGRGAAGAAGAAGGPNGAAPAAGDAPAAPAARAPQGGAGNAGAQATAPDGGQGAAGNAQDPQAAGRGGRGGRAGGAGAPPFVRRPITDEERQARLEAARLAAPPEPMVFTIDGKQVLTYVVQGTTDFEYARGENIVRVKLSAGDHDLRVSFPGYANMEDPQKNVNPADGRRRLYVDYVDVLGPYSPSSEPPPGFKKIFICSPNAQGGPSVQQCTHDIVDHLLTRAYRRPAAPDEVQKFAALAAQVQKKDSFEESIRVVIQAVLMSPNFLYRIERDPASAAAAVPAKQGSVVASMAVSTEPAHQTSYKVNDYELASRLSYFLWSSMPDDELFDTASKGKLHEPTVLKAQVERMLKDPRSASLADNFASQWLNLRLMDRKKPDAAKFPRVDDELLDAMRKETLMFVEAVIHEDRSVLDFLDGKFTYVNGPLARYYGIPGVDGEQRSGILTQASILSISSYATRTSPVLRGKWVLDNLLGAAPPPPPDGVPPLVEAGLGTATSMRERLEQHRANPSCSVCHNQMDPIGFGLENYDPSGAYRTKDGNFDIDSSGTLPDGRSFTGAKGLKETLRAQSNAFATNFTEKLMTYALGRGLERGDHPIVTDITSNAAANGYKFSTFVFGIINSRPFQMRSLPEGGN